MNLLSKRAKVQSDKPAYKEKKKTDKGYVWVYDEKHVEKRWKEKKEKLKKLEKELDKVRKQYKEDLKSDDDRTKAIAAIVGIMDETAMRIGNEDSAKEGTYGASTLKVKHVKGGKGKMTFDFPGKGAVEQNVALENNEVIKAIRDLMKGKKADDFIFEVEGKKIWDRAVNRYLQPFDISAKDLRGFHANRLMKEMLKKKDFDDALKEVAEIVGHKTSTLKNQYLDPELVEKHNGKNKKAFSIRAQSYMDEKEQTLPAGESRPSNRAVHVVLAKSVTMPNTKDFIAKLQEKQSQEPSKMVKRQSLSIRAELMPEHSKWVQQQKEKINVQPVSVRDVKKQTGLSKEDKRGLSIRPGVKVNKLMEDAWKTLKPFLPTGAVMTSGFRTDEDQLRILNNYWRKATGSSIPPQYLNDQRALRQISRLLKRHHGYIVGPPGVRPNYGHLSGNAFDISGADLDAIARAVNFVSSNQALPVKFRRPLIERRNNAVHVGVESASYDPQAVAAVQQQVGRRLASAQDDFDIDYTINALYEDLSKSNVPGHIVSEFEDIFKIAHNQTVPDNIFDTRLELNDEDMGFGMPDDMGDWFEKSPIFRHRDEEPEHDIQDVSDNEAKQLAKDDPDAFFYRGLHKDYPEEEALALKNMLEDNAKFYFVFKYHEREEDEFKELLEDAAEALSQQDARAFFYYHLHHKFPELGRGAIVQLIDTNPDSFFDLGLDKDYPDYIESANNARNIKDPNKMELEMPEWAEDMVSKKSLSVRDGIRKLSKRDKKEKDRKKGAGVFIVLPKEMSKQFPSLGEHDDSATHVTVLYIGEVPENKQETVYGVVRDVVKEHSPLKLQLDKKPSYFPATKHSDDCKVAKMAVVSKDLHKLHKNLKKALTEAGIDIDDHFPTYKPHVTLEYMEPPKEKYDGEIPSGSWTANHVQVWSCGNKKRIPFGKQKLSFRINRGISARAGSLGPIAPMKLRKMEDPDAMLKDHDDSDIIVQQKIDGFKTQAVKDKAGAVKLYTRRGEGFEANVPALVSELEDKMDSGDFWLGELAYLKNGKQSISDVQTIVGSNPDKAQEKLKEEGQLIFYVYDLLWDKGNNITKKPYIERYNKLKNKVGKSKLVQIVENYSWSEMDKATEDALKAGGEGVVLKPKDSEYKYAPKGSNEPIGEWAKHKPAGKKSNKDEVILKEYSKSKEKLVFPMYQYKDGKLFEVGQLSGMSKEDEAKIKKDIDAGKQVVVEITFQERMESGKFRHVGWSRFRPDKPAKEVKFSKASSVRFLSKRAKEESGSKYEKEKNDPKWQQVLIDEDRKWTRKQIRDHYLKNADNILKEIKGEPVMLYVNTGKTNQNVLKRKHDDKPITMNNKDDLEYWADRRLLSIHRVFGPETRLGFVDLDVHEGFSKDKTLKYAREVASKIKTKYSSKPVIYDSGGTGYHVEFHLKNKMKTDTLRNEIRELCEDLNEKHAGFTTGIVKGKGVRTDVTTLKNNGNIRVPYALHEKYGGIKKPAGGGNDARDSLLLSRRAWDDQLPGGLADKKNPSDFDQKALMKGIHVELEHTDDILTATEIAMDHLTEDEKYYDKLEEVEKHSSKDRFVSKRAKDPLSTYKKKRQFDETPEPEGKAEGKNNHRFVIQRHKAKQAGEHFDLRLENDDGTMSSWAIPKHKLPSKGEKLLATKTEDHPVSYNKFEGEIPEGEYGAGHVKIHDSGKYEEIEWSTNKIKFKLSGKKEKGAYTLVKTDGKKWLIMQSSEKDDENNG